MLRTLIRTCYVRMQKKSGSYEKMRHFVVFAEAKKKKEKETGRVKKHDTN